MPDYPAMGKRVLQDNGSWLRCLTKPNVDLVRTGIERIVPEGVVTVDGVFHEADIICYATGFRHNEFLAPMEVIGRNGVVASRAVGRRAHGPARASPFRTSRTCSACYGPGTNLAHGASLFFHSEFQVHYALDAIHRVLSSGARTIEVNKDAHDEYAERYRREIGQLVWSHPSITHSHYKNPQGKVFTLSPMADRAVLGVDARRRPRRLHHHLTKGVPGRLGPDGYLISWSGLTAQPDRNDLPRPGRPVRRWGQRLDPRSNGWSIGESNS